MSLFACTEVRIPAPVRPVLTRSQKRKIKKARQIENMRLRQNAASQCICPGNEEFVLEDSLTSGLQSPTRTSSLPSCAIASLQPGQLLGHHEEQDDTGSNSSSTMRLDADGQPGQLASSQQLLHSGLNCPSARGLHGHMDDWTVVNDANPDEMCEEEDYIVVPHL